MIGAIIGDIAGSGTGSFTADSVMFLAVGQSLMECDGNYSDLPERVKANTSALMERVYHKKASEMPFNRICCMLPAAYFARSYREVRQLITLMMPAVPGAVVEDAYAAELVTAEVFKYLRFLSAKSFKKAFLPKRFTFSRKTAEFLGEIDDAFRKSKSFGEAVLLAKETSDPSGMAAIVGGLAEPYHGVPVSFRDRALEALGPELADLLTRIESCVKLRVSTYVPDDTKPGTDHFDAARFYPSRWEYLKRCLGKPKDYYMRDPINCGGVSLKVAAVFNKEENNE